MSTTPSILERLRRLPRRITLSNRQILTVLVFATLANLPLGIWILVEQARTHSGSRDVQDQIETFRSESGQLSAQRLSSLERRVHLMEKAAEGYEARALEVGRSLGELIERAAALSRGDPAAERRLLELIRAGKALQVAPALDSERIEDLREAFDGVLGDLGSTRAEVSSLGHQIQIWIGELRQLRRRLNQLELQVEPGPASLSSLTDR